MLYPPTIGNRHRIVFLDAAGGGLARRATGTATSAKGRRVAALTLHVVLDAVRLLRARGFTVVASRSGPGTVTRPAAADVVDGQLSARGVHRDLAARDRCANQSHAALLVSVGFGDSGSPQAAGPVAGYETLRPFAEQNLQLAELMEGDVSRALDAHGWRFPSGVLAPFALPAGLAQDAAAATDPSTMLLGPRAGFNHTPSAMAGVLIEPLSLRNRSEANVAASAAGQQAVAGGIVAAIAQFPCAGAELGGTRVVGADPGRAQPRHGHARAGPACQGVASAAGGARSGGDHGRGLQPVADAPGTARRPRAARLRRAMAERTQGRAG